MTDQNRIPPGLRAQLAADAYQGIATFGRLPLATETDQLDAWRPQVAVVGAPWDGSTTNRPGARFGPRALRANSHVPGAYHLDLGIEIFDHLIAVDFGLRGYWPPPDVLQWMREQRMRTHFMHEIWDRGAGAVLDEVIAEALDGPDAIYLSIDIDVLDPGFAPGTGTPEPGGLAPVDLLRMVRRIALETSIVGMDVVEVAPAYDTADITVNNAHRLIWEVLAGMAVRRRDGGAQPSLGRDGEAG
jgi:arginase family enzyme